MLQGTVKTWICLSCFLLLGPCSPNKDAEPAGPWPTSPPEQESGEPDLEDWELGSGSALLHLLHNFPADSPFVSSPPENPANCSQHFWLPPSSPVCWENVARPEEFARSRLFVLQNRAALQAVSSMSGVEETGLSYNHQAREEVLGIHSDHQKVKEMMQTMESVFTSLKEKRKEAKEEQGVFTSLKSRLADTRDALGWREDLANNLERQLFTLERTLLNSQLRLSRLISQ